MPPRTNYYGNITRYALSSRITIIILQYFGNIVIPDHEASVFVHLQRKDNYSVIDKTIHHLLGGFIRWDAHYFMHIAKYGYTYENTLAFFPLYPLTVRYVSLLIHLVFPWINLDSILLLVFLGLNFVLFLLCTRLLFKLTAIIFDKRTAYGSTLLFCFNPASIFFTAPYTECTFFYFTLLSILNSIEMYKKYYNINTKVDYRDVIFIWPVCLSTVTRSNGLLNIGFPAYMCLCLCKKHWPDTLIRKIKCSFKTALVMCLLIIVCVIPFSIYQMYCYYMFCTNHELQLPSSIMDQAKDGFVLPGQFLKNNQSWCYDKIPLAYSYVQAKYWNVGFLKYYELKQVPNFFLAAPILTILLKKSYYYLKHNIIRSVFDVFTFDILFKKKKYANLILNPILNVFVIHILFLTLFCILCVHIQVSTRMLCSASPVLYWFCASLFKNVTVTSSEHYSLVMYFLSYFILGTILFCNFLPWT